MTQERNVQLIYLIRKPCKSGGNFFCQFTPTVGEIDKGCEVYRYMRFHTENLEEHLDKKPGKFDKTLR